MANVVDVSRNFLNSKLKLAGTGIGIFIILMIIWDGFVMVPAGHVGVVFDMGRGILENEMDEGLHLKIPIWQKVTVMDARTQEYTMSIAPGEGSKYSDDSIEARSKDGQIIRIDATILFKIDRDKANLIRKNLGTESEYSVKIIRPKVREVIRGVVARYEALDLVSEKRGEIVDEMTKDLSAGYAEHYIILEKVLLRNVTYSAEFGSIIEQKKIAEQQIKIAEYQKKQAEELKEKKIIEAQADAEAIRLKGEALRNNPEVIKLEFIQKMAPDINWGVLPSEILPLINLGG